MTNKIARIYCRVSTDFQATEGVSLEAQSAKAKAWCVANDYHVAEIYVDAGLSGKRADNRPELQRALTDCKKVMHL
jgi:site-specific DNA recombinase